MIHLTPEAIKEFKRLGKYRHHDLNHDRLRVGIQPGCCAQFSYSLSFDSNLSEADVAIDSEELAIVIHRQDTETLDGLTIHYSEDLMGGTFRFLNPNAAYTCDCGSGFSLDSPSDHPTIL